MNLWHVRLAEQDGGIVVVCGDQSLELPAAVLARRRGLRSFVGGHLVLGVRPEQLGLARSTAAGPVLDLPVTYVETLGSHLLVHLEAEGAGMHLAEAPEPIQGGVRGVAAFTRPAATLIARLPAQTVVNPGERVRLSVDLERAHFFDPATQFALR